MGKVLPIWIAAAALVSYGIAAGRSVRGPASQRMAPPSDALRAAASQLQFLPLTLGEWRGQAIELNADLMESARVSGYIHRIYVHEPTGEAVRLLIVVGPSFPIADHGPEICYPSLGFEAAAKAEKVEWNSPDATGKTSFWFAPFLRTGVVVAEPLRVYWSWTVDGAWQAVDHPVSAFAEAPLLFKCYASYAPTTLEEPIQKDPTASFLMILIPELKRTVFGSERP
jgi:hypothetical protein